MLLWEYPGRFALKRLGNASINPLLPMPFRSCHSKLASTWSTLAGTSGQHQ
ncbi:predicted protein [Sclerotinia sclerotiorum 1980 UF-70]|uniref:Uncharacterized protein n=1 Tax=Sclerotinia sclerotiorum (strain ATCC 18683 / 1980 / Ss-1) TaxID=665079 RepID=A7EEU2_SCLS1|nr:predicted protein [Sclerotinia sclerotiorum 1980 UF-70]EDO01358.1 predicted protein [Sclerotinia sclerotiorum 1980 UF-70]